MKINDVNRAGAVNPYRKQNELHANDGIAKKQASKDQLQISTEAKELLELQMSGGTDRAQRIEELKQAVQEGTYRVPAQQIADKLIRYYMNEPE